MISPIGRDGGSLQDAPSTWLDSVQRTTLLVTIFLFLAGYPPVGLVCVLPAVVAEGIDRGRIPWRRGSADFLLVAFVVIFLISGLLSPYSLIAFGEAILLAVTIYFTFGPLY